MTAPAFLSLVPLGTPPKYLNLAPENETCFNEIRKDFADVRLISSDNDTYLCSKLFLASMSQYFYELIQDVYNLDDANMLVIHTNLSSDELKIVTQFVMFGYLPSSSSSGKDSHQDPIQCVPPDENALELLKCFGIDATSFNFHYTTPKIEEERLVHPTDNEEFFWLQQKDALLDVQCKEESRNSNNVLQVTNSIINDTDFLNGSEFLAPDMSYYGEEVAFPSRRKLYSDAQVKVELDDFDYDDVDMEGIAEVDDPTYEVALPKRKRKLGKRAQKSVHGHKKEYIDPAAKRKKKRVSHFYNQFVVEAEKHQLSPASFAAYLGYRACLNGDPIAASDFKKLHEEVSTNEQDTASRQTKEGLMSTENGKSETQSSFIKLTYEEKASSVGQFYDIFLKEAEGQEISASSLAAYCGARSTYRTDRTTAAVFRKLHDNEDVKDKWSFKLWSLVDKEKDSSSVYLPKTSINLVDNKEMQCIACGKSLKGKVALRSHMKKLHPNYNNKCLSCNQGSFSNWQDHIEHANQFHDGIIRRKCNICELMFDSAEELNSHKSSQHSGKAGLVTCTECGKQLMPDTMKGHMITEHGTEPCSCPKCGKQFKHPLALDQHFKRAHEECQCDECGRVCNSKKALKLHILTIHTPDHLKPWRCSRCTKGFTEKGRLADHMNVHLGIKPHNCEQCGQSFSNDSNKRAHIKSVHMGLKRSK